MKMQNWDEFREQLREFANRLHTAAQQVNQSLPLLKSIEYLQSEHTDVSWQIKQQKLTNSKFKQISA